jgi:ribonuclease E
VDLPSGGYVIIEPTEALTVIDVNSGSFTRSANARETVLWTNYEAATEIARQLKLRNIGGVVIIDFIDMESRRDQLQLLEHFTAAIRPDSARPQIAQISELGLVELTRKRQGQNIYELFGRACPSCGGLGHVAVLPGKDSLQPLAAAPGLVRSAASARAEVFSPAGAESGGGRRRRGGRAGRGGSEAPELASYDDTTTTAGSSHEAATAAAEPGSRRPEPELVAVPMDSAQELVYGWLGLNPALLLDPVPAADNLVVRVVRPGEDADAVLEEARQQLAAAGPRRRRRGRGGASTNGAGSPTADSSAPSESLPVTVEITPLPVETFPAFPTVPVLPDSGLELVAATAEPEPANGRRVRSRRRSDAPASTPATSTAVAVLPVVEPELAAAAAPAEAEDDASEPRRRRRRSSATE